MVNVVFVLCCIYNLNVFCFVEKNYFYMEMFYFDIYFYFLIVFVVNLVLKFIMDIIKS